MHCRRGGDAAIRCVINNRSENAAPTGVLIYAGHGVGIVHYQQDADTPFLEPIDHAIVLFKHTSGCS